MVELKLGKEDEPNLPGCDCQAWCRHIDEIVRKIRPASFENNENLNIKEKLASSLYNFDNVKANSIEKMVYKNDELSALDNELPIIYSAAFEKAVNEDPLLVRRNNAAG